MLIPSKVQEQITKKFACMYLGNKVAIIRSLHFWELSHAKVKLIIF